MTPHHKLIAGTVAVAVVAGCGAALAAIELGSSSSAATPTVTTRPVTGIGSYGLGPGRFGGRGFAGGLGPGGDEHGRMHEDRDFLDTGVAAAAGYLGVPAD